MQRFVLVPLLTIAGLAVLSFLLWLTSGPTITLAPTTGAIGGGRSFTVDVAGPRNGLKNLKITAVQGGKSVDVVTKAYPAAPPKAQEVFTLAQAGLKDGPFTLQLSASGSTLFSVRSKSTVVVYAFVYESAPPVVAVLSTAHNIIRGGVGLVTYTISKEVEKTGVVFGTRFFPGYKQEGGFYACLFPFPWNMTPDQYVPRVIAVDRAGNERITGINFNLLPKTFTTDQINLTDALLDKLSVEFKNKFPQAKTPLEIFLKANGELREQNRKALYEYGKQTSPVPLWEGDFLRMPNTAPLGGFAQTRTYLYQGQKVDEQTHLGFDLASVIHAPVPAANRGKVVYAGDLGIYGQCVVIDHGLGLQTLYAHLNQMSVKAGEMVEKGQTIGNTGSTGMAAGDHLHYGVTISGEEVNPVEWWDGHWIKDNVSSKLDAAKGSSPRSTSRRLRRVPPSRDHAMPTVVGLLIGIAAGAGDLRTVAFR